MTGRRSRLTVAIGAALAVAAAVALGLVLLGGDDDADRDRPAQARPADRSRAEPRPVRIADLLRDPSALADARVALRDVRITRRVSDHVAIADGTALLVSPRRALPPVARCAGIDVEGHAVMLPARELVDDLREAAPAGLLELAGFQPDALADIGLLVVADAVRTSAR